MSSLFSGEVTWSTTSHTVAEGKATGAKGSLKKPTRSLNSLHSKTRRGPFGGHLQGLKHPKGGRPKTGALMTTESKGGTGWNAGSAPALNESPAGSAQGER